MPIRIDKPDTRKPGKRGLQGKQGIQGVRGVQGVQGIAGKDGQNGIDGRDGQDGSKWYDGKGAPEATLGATGDFYLDNDTYDYYEKTTRWIKRGNLKGAKGDKGDKGERGAKGARGNDGGVGTPGADGQQGPQGPQGMQGVQGDPGVGVPVGGTAGQVLAKDTNADYDTTWVNPAGGAVDSVNGQTGVVVLDQDDIGDGTTYKQYSDTEKTKLAGIEAGAEVNNISDANATDLTDGGNTTLHSHTVTKSDVGLGNVDNTSDANKPISTATQTALDGKVDENGAITGATKTKITYDAKGLVTAGADATTADIAASTDKNYVTDAQATVIGNTSGTNTGDNATNTQYSGLAASKQNADATLTSLAAYNTNGLLTQTATDTFAGRTITGTTNQVTVTNGDGVSGNPTLSLPQDIATSSAPTFAGGTITGPLKVYKAATSISNRIGIGTTSPQYALHIVTEATNGVIGMNMANSDGSSSGGGSGIIGGTTTIPTASGHRLGFFLFHGANNNSAGMLGYATEAWSGSARGTRLAFETTANASTTRTERVYLDNNGWIPATDSTYTLGTSALYWSNTYTDRLYLNSTAYADGATAGQFKITGLLMPVQATTAGAPAYVKGAMYFDTTLNKLRVGGAAGWESITSI